MADPWRTSQFGTGYSAEWLPVGMHTWRILKQNGKVKVFRSARDALKAAKTRFLSSLEPEIRATIPTDPDRIAEKLRAEAESWLRSSREDEKARTIIRRPGRKQVIVMRGRA